MPVIKLANEAHIYERITPDHRLTGYQVKIRRVGYPPYKKTFVDLKEARIAVTRVLADQRHQGTGKRNPHGEMRDGGAVPLARLPEARAGVMRARHVAAHRHEREDWRDHRLVWGWEPIPEEASLRRRCERSGQSLKGSTKSSSTLMRRGTSCCLNAVSSSALMVGMLAAIP